MTLKRKNKYYDPAPTYIDCVSDVIPQGQIPIIYDEENKILLSGKTQITYKSLRNSLYIGNSAFFFEIQAPLIK